jgi:hypothetical protein
VVAAPTILAGAIAQQAQQDSLKRTMLQTGDFPAGYETVMVIAEMKLGNCSGWQTHPGIESAYFVEERS